MEWLLVSKSPALAHGNMVAKEAEPGMAMHHAERPIELPGLHKGCGPPALHPALCSVLHIPWFLPSQSDSWEDLFLIPPGNIT